MTTNLSPYKIEPLRLGLHLFQLSETDTCEAITRADWPTREKDGHCGSVPAYVCMKCEMPLCVVHLETCPFCNMELCDGCLAIHQERCRG